MRLIEVDPLRIVLSVVNDRLSGYELQRLLEQRGCWAEMSDPRHVVLIIGIGTSEFDTEKLIRALAEIEEAIVPDYVWSHAVTDVALYHTDERLGQASAIRSITEPVSFSRQGVPQADIEMIALEQAAGRMAAESIIPYPPGIPILYAGERITREMANYIGLLAVNGAKCQGVTDPSLATIAVLKEGVKI